MWGRLHGLIGKEFAQMLRDPVVLFLILFLATVELAMCAMALGFDVKNLKLGVIDHDRSAASRRLVQELTSADTFVLRNQFASMRDAEGHLRAGALDVVIEVPANFGARIAAGRQASVGVVVDGSNADVAARARAYIIEMTARFAQQRMTAMPMPGGVQPAVHVWYNPDLTNTRLNALAMLTQAGFMLAIILPAAGLVREKQSGTLEQIRVTPIRAHELFIGKIVPPVVFVLGSLFPSLLVIRLLGVPLNGSLATFVALDLIFLMSAVSIGIFIATISTTLQQALLTSFFGLFPLLFLSGGIAPIESMPYWLQVGIEISPLRHFIEITTGLFLKGAGIAELWPHGLALVAIGLPLFSASWLLFKRQW
ncbi:ABC transporter permease [Sphingomonas canadensis]|uniref:ABC transporter permease n=1 Tax=Sphingomonas canadensis TaxID=1219257 RepID=A0ABW3H7I5_9SPHN|nr:ABC transporter permease [Sphingomonas canadensis]MCW3837304.1 ABC transporter permease [Sphingomonas canadensis]